MNLDWSPLQNIRDPGQAFMQGLEQGRQRRKQQEIDNALRQYDPNNPQSANALIQADPVLGTKLLQSGLELQKMQDERGLNRAFAGMLGGGQPQQGGPAAQSGMPQGAAPVAPQAGAIPQAGGMQGISPALIEIAKYGGPKAFFEARKLIQGMDKDQIEATAARFKAAAPSLIQLSRIPKGQRMAHFQQVIAPNLMQLGWTPQQIASVNPDDDQQLSGYAALGLTANEVIELNSIDHKQVEAGARLEPFDAFGRPVGDAAGAQQTQPQTATNPQTGERIMWNPQTGQWEPMQGGAGSQTPRPFP